MFDETSPGDKIDIEKLFGLDEDKKRSLWILTDAALLDEGWNRRSHSWLVVLAASPLKVKASRQWEKDRNVGVHFMRNWAWAEIVAAFRY